MKPTLILGVCLAGLLFAGSVRADQPAGRIAVIYNHGSGNGVDCEPIGFGRFFVPRWVKRLDGTIIAGRRVTVMPLCSDVADDDYADASAVCSLDVCRRAHLIGTYIDGLVGRGYLRKHIFLAGQSAGAWTSLMVKRAAPASVNGLLLTAPAFGGKRSERLCRTPDCSDSSIGGQFRAVARREVDRWLAGEVAPPDLNALIVSFHCDAFGEGWELPTEGNPSIERRVFPPLDDVTEPLRCQHEETRFYNGAAMVLCTDASTRQDFLGCGRNRVRNCPARFRKVCREKSHTFFRRRAFTRWASDEALARDFIAGAIAGWSYGAGAPASDAPCPFTATLPQCR